MIPTEALAEHVAVIGKTGAGKTYLAKTLAEDALDAGERFCVLDPTGVWWGLKAGADGKSPGFPVVVFGGDHADVPLREGDGETIARIVATTSTPCVIDLTGLGPEAQTAFSEDFAGHLYLLNRGHLRLFVDEADAFMPQTPGKDEMGMRRRWDTIARRGRSRGFALTLITQRPAVLNKNALSQVSTLVALKVTSPQDKEALGRWILGQADRDLGKEVLDSLPTLARGEGWVWSPGHDVLERTQVRAIRTWDSSRTPGAGEARLEAKVLAPVDVAAIRRMMLADQTAEAAVATAVAVPAMSDAQRREIYDEGFKAGDLSGYNRGHAAGMLDGVTAAMQRFQTDLRAWHDRLDVDLRKRQSESGQKVVPLGDTPQPITGKRGLDRALDKLGDAVGAEAVKSEPAREEPGAATIGMGGQKVLDALAWWARAGFSTPDRRRVCVLAGYSPKASTFGVYVAQLTKGGLVEVPAAGALRLTASGAAAASPPAKGVNLLAACRALVSPAEAKVFDVLVEIYPDDVDRGALADRLGLSRTASTLGVYLSTLSGFSLTEVSNKGRVRASAWIFAKGKR